MAELLLSGLLSLIAERGGVPEYARAEEASPVDVGLPHHISCDPETRSRDTQTQTHTERERERERQRERETERERQRQRQRQKERQRLRDRARDET